jgi:hypothetical protein
MSKSRAENLITTLLEASGEIHPEYTKEQRLIWVLGFLADLAVEKNSYDNIVFDRMWTRIERLRDQRKD